jgi:hypothetical protein
MRQAGHLYALECDRDPRYPDVADRHDRSSRRDRELLRLRSIADVGDAELIRARPQSLDPERPVRVGDGARYEGSLWCANRDRCARYTCVRISVDDSTANFTGGRGRTARAWATGTLGKNRARAREQENSNYRRKDFLHTELVAEC